MWWLLALIASVSLLTFILLFGRAPAFKNSIIGSAYVFLAVSLPSSLYKLDLLLCKGAITNHLQASFNYLLYDRNWAVVIIYAAIVLFEEYLFFSCIFPTLPGLLQLLSIIIAPLSFVALFFACTADPGVITPQNVQRAITLNPYDRLLFMPSECSSCKILKPARSKHCSICKCCISKVDHHCPWINACIGQNNQRFFILFCLANVLLTFTGLILSAHAVLDAYRDYIDSVDPPLPSIWNPYTFKILLREGYIESGHFIVFWTSLLMLPLALAFSFQQLLFIAMGYTLNEHSKWQAIKAGLADGNLDQYVDVNGTPYGMGPNGSGSIALQWLGNSYNRTLTPEEDQMIQSHDLHITKVTSWKQLNNMYDKGVIGNFKEVFFGPFL
ncbi:hypothetical protein CANCADRAFT_44177 [Tortispora caseinolytica NRRL Y-17796]|uniref:Palmitoyltransferase n=1 Tax=Tortispora caseinolytica NRRL Y-17796 TaxID=767744 RepID=A0A1E4TFN3_9ASCO|nr:hypothetical protein CANCADRAFT_44177 [Tortispora caseinolytica NRRL Y-17796]